MNKYRDCLYILAEDRKLSEVVNGYLIAKVRNQRKFKILPYDRGWRHVFDKIKDFKKDLDRYPDLRILLIIDFDSDYNRLNKFTEEIGEEYAERMFVLGPYDNVEALKRCCNTTSTEQVGKLLAQTSPRSSLQDNPWKGEQLNMFSSEIERFFCAVSPFLCESEY